MKALCLLVSIIVILTALSGCAWIQSWLNANNVPVAVITASCISGEAPLEVTFDASESYDPDGDELTYEWGFGDGTIGQGQTVTHTFSSAGNHSVQLAVTDTKGARDLSSITIVVSLETVSDTIGITGGTVSTNQGSSVTVPGNTLADGSVVSISELVEPAVQFKPDVTLLGNGVLITLLSSSINTTVLKSQSLLETTPGIITIRVPLPSNMQAPSPDVITGCLLEFTAGDRSTQMVVGMDREGDVAKVSVPVELIAEFAGGALPNASNKAIRSSLSYLFSRISVTLFAKIAGHIPPILYRAESSSDFVPVGLIPTVNEASISYTFQDLSIIPIILIHGYKIARVDEVAITALSSGTSPGYRAYAQESWKNFIDHFYEHCRADLKKKLPAGYDFRLYVYRWDTDEGFDKAGTGLARLINGCFGDRPFILIGHSAGGIVARVCVEHNESLANNFPGIITLASPHKGVLGASIFVDKSARELENENLNPWLKELNENAKYTGKIITYGGFITDASQHSLKLQLGWNALVRLKQGENDGAVPFYSGLAEGYSVRERHGPYEDYDHGEMLCGKEGDSSLFKSICGDLQQLAGELALPAPMETAQLSINIDPSPASFNTGLDSELGWHYTVTISEGKGIGVEIERVAFDYYDADGNWIITLSSGPVYFDAYFDTHQVAAGGNISSPLYQTPGPEKEIAMTEWTVFGIDDNGNEVEASAIVYLAQDVHRGMTVSIVPDPVVLQPGGGWHYDITIAGTNAVGISIIGVQKVYHDKYGIWQQRLTKGSSYAKQIFGTDHIPAMGSISATVSEAYRDSFYNVDWTIVGMDDRGRTVYGAYDFDLNHGDSSSQELSQVMPLGIPK